VHAWPWRRKGPKGKDAGQGWFINNAKCLNIENSSALPKGDDKASVTCLRGTRCARLITYEWNCRRAFAIRAASARRQVSAIQFLKFHFVCRTDTYVMYGNAQRCVRSAPLASGKTRRGFARISKLRAARAHHYYYYGRFPSAVNYMPWTIRAGILIGSRHATRKQSTSFPPLLPRRVRARYAPSDIKSWRYERWIAPQNRPSRNAKTWRDALRASFCLPPPFPNPPELLFATTINASTFRIRVRRLRNSAGTFTALAQIPASCANHSDESLSFSPSFSLSLSSLLFSINTRASLTSCPRARRSETNFNLARWLHGAYRQTSN